MVQSLLALSQKLFAWPTFWGYLGDGTQARVGENPLWVEPAGRAVGTFAHPIPLATVIGIGLVTAIGTSKFRSKIATILLASILVGGLAATGTRSAIIGLIACAAVALFHAPVVRRQPLLGVLVVSLGLAASLVAQPIDVADLFQLDGSLSLTHRVGSWAILPTLLSIGTTPFIGLGWGAITYLSQRSMLQSTTLTAIDNSLVSTVAIGGIPALIFLILLIVVALARATPVARACLVFASVMLLSFDLLLWLAPLAVFVVLTQLPGAKQVNYEATFIK